MFLPRAPVWGFPAREREASHGGCARRPSLWEKHGATHNLRVLAIQGFYPHFGFLNEVERKGGIFFQIKGKGQDGVISCLGKTKRTKNRERKILSSITRLGCQVP